MKLRCLFTRLLPAAALTFTSCREVEYYRQAAAGQWHICRDARPIPEVLTNPATPEHVRAKLRLVGELRQFAASHLGLPAESQYDRYCDLQRKYVVWVVFAAPEFSVEAKTWHYPLIGSLKYRGYFTEESATAEAGRLQALGYDVYQTGTEAYSTLGWLRDPVLNTFLTRSDADLAELIFHELTHQKLYLSGDTDFNEAFATAVGEAGARQWMKAKGRTAELKTWENRQSLQREIIAAMLETRGRLDRLYQTGNRFDPEKLRAMKTSELEALHRKAMALRAARGIKSPVRGAPSRDLNNASLNSIAAYYILLPAFERLLAAEAGNIPRFIDRVAAMKSLTKSERRELLASAAPDQAAR